MLGCLQYNFLYEITWYWLAIAGVIGFVAMGVDKARAHGGGQRIPESTLLAISLAGGLLGAAAGAVVFHHKTSKLRFVLLLLLTFIPWFLLLQGMGFLGCLGTYLPT